MLGDVNKLFVFKSFFTEPSNVLPLHLKQAFLHIFWIFTEVEGDGIESKLPFKIFPTLYVLFPGVEIKVPRKHLISPESIQIQKELGNGEFGVVQQGVWIDKEQVTRQVKGDPY